jgi:hypothetical protein
VISCFKDIEQDAAMGFEIQAILTPAFSARRLALPEGVDDAKDAVVGARVLERLCSKAAASGIAW